MDPLFNETLDAYGYANNNPIGESDPSGDCGTVKIGVVAVSKCGASNVKEISAEYMQIMKTGEAGGDGIIRGTASGELAALYAICVDGKGCSSWLRSQLMLAGTGIMAQQQVRGVGTSNVAAADLGLEISLAAKQHLTLGQKGDDISFGTFGMAAAAAAGAPGVGQSLSGEASLRQVVGWLGGVVAGGVGGAYEGGTYGNLDTGGGIELHHMPANSVSPLSKNAGPAIQMDQADHMETASWGSSSEAVQYRAAQQELINQGRFNDAVQMDIDNVTSSFPGKYDDAILQMMEYVPLDDEVGF